MGLISFVERFLVMKIHHLRNATFIIESNDRFILADPMLGAKGSLPAFSYFRFKKQSNPTVELPPNSSKILNKVTDCLITHSHSFGFKLFQHTDHLDIPGENFLKDRNIPIICGKYDEKYLKKLGLPVNKVLDDWKFEKVFGGKICRVPAQHGYGWIHKLMGNPSGFYLELPNEPSLYISGNTILTNDVKKVLTDFKPDISIVPAGTAQMDIGQPILMKINDLITFARLTPGKVIYNHLEALNMCPTSRKGLKNHLTNEGLFPKCFIPNDGECIDFS